MEKKCPMFQKKLGSLQLIFILLYFTTIVYYYTTIYIYIYIYFFTSIKVDKVWNIRNIENIIFVFIRVFPDYECSKVMEHCMEHWNIGCAA